MALLKKIFIGILILFVGFMLFKNPVIKSVVCIGTSHVTGTPTKIGKFQLGVFKPMVSIKDFKMFNPKGFPKEHFIHIPEMTVEYSPLAIFKGKVHLRRLVFDLREVILVKDNEGNLNVDSLKVAQKKDEEKKDDKKDKKKKPSKKMKIQMDEVRLNLGKVIVKDYSNGEPPQITAHDVGIKDKVYKDLTSVEQLVAMVMMEAMGPTALKGGAMYAAATVLGVGFLPAGVAGVLIAKDSGTAEFQKKMEDVYQVVLEELKKSGRVSKEDAASGVIKAKVDGAGITAEISQKDAKTVTLKVSARKYMLPKPEIANGIIYQVTERLK